MTEEWNLSEKIRIWDKGDLDTIEVLSIWDVKKFINEREGMLVEFIEDHTITKPAGKLIKILPFEWDDFLAKWRKLAGEELSK